MSTIKMSEEKFEEIDHQRRRFFGTTAMTIAPAQLGALGSTVAGASNAMPASATTSKPGTNTSFGPLKQIDAGPVKNHIPVTQPLPEKSYKRECQETFFSVGSVPTLFCLGIQPNRLNVHS